MIPFSVLGFGFDIKQKDLVGTSALFHFYSVIWGFCFCVGLYGSWSFSVID